MMDAQIIRFLVVGASNFAVSFVVFHLLSSGSGLTFFTAQCLSYTAGIVWSFVWNWRWTFSGAGRASRALPRFLLVQGALLLLSAGLISAGAATLDLHPSIIWFVVMTGITLLNFAVNRYWVFRGGGA